MSTNKNGYVLPMALMIIIFSLAMLTSIMNRAFLFQDEVFFEKRIEQVRMIALSGIHIAMARLSFIANKEKDKIDKIKVDKSIDKLNTESSELDKQMTDEQKWLYQTMLLINKWHNYKLTKDIDGVDANIEIYISCEQGKINLNKLLLDDKKEKILEEILKSKDDKSNTGKNISSLKNYAQALEEKLTDSLGVNIVETLRNLKQRSLIPLQDLSEVLFSPPLIKKFKDHIFISPDHSKSNSKEYYLSDLFTVETKTEKLNPWLLSASLCKLLGFKLPSKGVDHNTLKNLVKNLRGFIGWKKDWDTIMQPLYGKPFNSIEPGIETIFSPEFEATLFSVVSYAKIDNITQKVAAVLERIMPSDNTSSGSIIFRIKKLYWL